MSAGTAGRPMATSDRRAPSRSTRASEPRRAARSPMPIRAWVSDRPGVLLRASATIHYLSGHRSGGGVRDGAATAGRRLQSSTKGETWASGVAAADITIAFMAECEESVRAMITRGREARFLEYKESQPWSDIEAKIVRTALAMANLRDGGFIVIDVSERSGMAEPRGVAEEVVATFDPDAIRARINRYADPYVDVDVFHCSIDGRSFIVIAVEEFAETPILCRRDGDGLRRGALYIRSRRIPETSEVQTSTEMRELLDLATEKQFRRFAAMLSTAGFDLGSVRQASAERRLDEELEGL